MLILGILLNVWANYTLLYLGKISLSAREPMQTPSNLVVDDPFRYGRNPIYLAGLMMLLGLVIAWSSLAVLLGLIVVYIVFRYIFIKREEIILEEAFGTAYLEYKQCVSRWF
jgi:protein-S-isoprenylcysteine O-methyltransferase Ste14